MAVIKGHVSSSKTIQSHQKLVTWMCRLFGQPVVALFTPPAPFPWSVLGPTTLQIKSQAT